MANITRDSFVKLVNCPVTKEHQLTFLLLKDQTEYFVEELSGLTLEDFSYIRKDSILRVPEVIDDLEIYNYVVVRNESYTEKYYYYYIDEMKYINDNMTEIKLKLDVFQTYQFDFKYMKSFVEREHVSNDSIGANTIPEGLELGEYITDTYDYCNYFDQLCYLVNASKPYDATSGFRYQTFTNINGINQAGFFFVCGNTSALIDLLDKYEQNEYATLDSVDNIYAVPISSLNQNNIVVDPNNIEMYMGDSAPQIDNYEIAKPTSINGYVPKNKKLFTYPYCYLLVGNANGGSNIYHFEKFKSEKARFIIQSVPTCGCSIKLTPELYTQNLGYDDLEILIGGKYPTLNYSKDKYQEWLHQNALNLNGQIATNTLATAYNIYTKDYAGTVGSLMNVFDTVKQVYVHQMLPSSFSGAVNGGDVQVASDSNGFTFQTKTIRSEVAKIIDEFFTAYGYKVNRLKVPNIKTRTFFNYVKTSNANVLAKDGIEIPDIYLKEFKEMLNNGITFWHNPLFFLDYSVNNT